MTREGRASTSACYFASFVALGLVVASLGPTLPALAALTHAHLASASALFVARQLGYLSGTLFGGRAFDRVPGHPLLAGVLGSLVVSVALAPSAGVLWAVTAVLGVVGIAEGMLDVGVNTLIVWAFRERSGPRLNALHASFGLGAFLSPLVVVGVAEAGGVGWAYRTLALALLPLPAWLLALPSPAPVAYEPSSRRRSYDVGLVALIAAFFFVYTGSEAAIGGWAYTYTTATGLGSERTGAYMTSAFWGALTVGRTIAIPIVGRFRPERVLAVAVGAGLASVLVAVAAPASLGALVVCTLGAGLTLSVVFPTTLALAGRYLPVTGAVNSWFFAGASLGAMGLPWLIGQFFESVGPRVTWVMVAGDLAASLAILACVVVRVRRVRRDEPTTSAV